MLDLRVFFSDLRSILSPGVLRWVGRKVLDDDCAGLAGQLAYFTLFSLFPFLLSLVALVGLVIDDPATLLRTLTERMQGFVPGDAVGLLEGYIELTLRNANTSKLVFGVLATFWSGWAAADAIIKAVNRAYELQETRPATRIPPVASLGARTGAMDPLFTNCREGVSSRKPGFRQLVLSEVARRSLARC